MVQPLLHETHRRLQLGANNAFVVGDNLRAFQTCVIPASKLLHSWLAGSYMQGMLTLTQQIIRWDMRHLSLVPSPQMPARMDPSGFCSRRWRGGISAHPGPHRLPRQHDSRGKPADLLPPGLPCRPLSQRLVSLGELSVRAGVFPCPFFFYHRLEVRCLIGVQSVITLSFAGVRIVLHRSLCFSIHTRHFTTRLKNLNKV